MNEENTKIFQKTWLRSVEQVVKAGYMDGAAAGQSATFQSSFNVGYEQGLQFGMTIGLLNQANGNMSDPRRINCHLCNNETMMQEKVDNLYNIQEEKNTVLLRTLKK